MGKKATQVNELNQLGHSSSVALFPKTSSAGNDHILKKVQRPTPDKIPYVTYPVITEKRPDYQTKTCCRCNEDKLLSEFYRDKRLADGLYACCKSCHRQVLNIPRQTPQGKSELRTYSKTPKAKATRKRYSQTPKGKVANYQCTQRHIKKHPQRARCRWAFNKSVQRGYVIRPSHCSLCGTKCKPHGHHPDYTKPLDVKWVCRKCHLKCTQPISIPDEGSKL